jgi:hypothetical protein
MIDQLTLFMNQLPDTEVAEDDEWLKQSKFE